MRKAVTVTATVLATLTVAALGTSASAGSDGPGYSAAAQSGDRTLAAVSAVSKSDAWAVGSQEVDGADQPLVRHWDGNTWTDVAIADSGPGEVELTDVAAVSSSDVWIVGNIPSVTPLAEHWDGSTWQVVPAPANQDRLWSVAGSGPDDVWALGDTFFEDNPRPSAGHWDGTRWVDTPLQLPDLPPGRRVTWWFADSVSVLSAKDAWITGFFDDTGEGNPRTPFVEHWNGSRWRLMPTLPRQSFTTEPTAASAIARNDVWVVGAGSAGGPVCPWAAHWDGRTWTFQAWPVTGRHQYALSSVTAIAPDDVWAVGYDERHVLAKHWDGQQWTDDPNADPGRHHLAAELSGVDAVDATHVFAVGQLSNRDLGVDDVFAEAWNGKTWRIQH